MHIDTMAPSLQSSSTHSGGVSKKRLSELKATLRKSVRSSSEPAKSDPMAALLVPNGSSHSTGGTSRIAELKARLRNSIHEGALHKKSWHGKDWDDWDDSDAEDGDGDDLNNQSFNNGAFQDTFRRSSAFWSTSAAAAVPDDIQEETAALVPTELKAKAETLGVTKNGVSKRRVLNLKGLMQAAVLDQVDENNRQQKEDGSAEGDNNNNGTKNNLLSLMVKASKQEVRKQQEITGRLFQTNNKLLQLQYDRAAKRIQRFFKRTIHVIHGYQIERRYLKAQLKDVRRRRTEELDDVQAWIQQEKLEFALSLQAEYSDGDDNNTDWKQYSSTISSLKQELKQLKADNETLEKDTQQLQHETEQQQLEARHPDLGDLKRKIQQLTKDNEDWTQLQEHYNSAKVAEASASVEAMTGQYYSEKLWRRKTSKTIDDIIEKTHADDCPKAVRNKEKRDYQYRELKEARKQGWYPIHDRNKFQQTKTSVQELFDAIKAKRQSTTTTTSTPPVPTNNNSNNNNPPPSVKEEKKEEPREPSSKSPPATDEGFSGWIRHPVNDDNNTPKHAQFEALYELGDKLGEGENGAVYKCRHKEKGGDERAVKIIEKTNMDEWEYEDVMAEFKLLTEIDNDNVIRVYEFHDLDDNFYIVQELVKGGELYDELISRGKLPEKDVATLMRSLLSCVQHLADSGIVHRDLNLENVLLDDVKGNYEKIKLIDFGLAAKCEEGERLYEMVGKARYIAPEILGDSGYGLKADVWSCGVTAYTLLAGFHPFEADYDADVYPLIVDGYYDFKDAVWDNVSEQAKDFISKLLTHKEQDRPTAAEALNHPWFTNNNTGITFSAEAPRPKVVFTESSRQTVAEQVAETTAAAQNPELSKTKKKKRKSKKKSGETPELNTSVSFHGDDIDNLFGGSNHSQPKKLQLSDLTSSTHSNKSLEGESSHSKKQRKKERQIARQKAEEAEVADLLKRKRSSKLETDGEFFNRVVFSGANQGTKKTTLSGKKLIGAAAMKGAVKDLMGRQRRASALQKLMSGADDSSDDEVESPVAKRTTKKMQRGTGGSALMDLVAGPGEDAGGIEDKEAAPVKKKKKSKSMDSGVDKGDDAERAALGYDQKSAPVAKKKKSKSMDAGVDQAALGYGEDSAPVAKKKKSKKMQRRGSALMDLVTGLGDDGAEEEEQEPVLAGKPKRRSSTSMSGKEESKPSGKSKGVGKAKLKGAVKQVMSKQRGATALMSLISNLGDGDSDSD